MVKGSRKLLSFFLMAFAWMWGLNLPRVLAEFGAIEIPGWLSTTLGYLAAFAPSIMAFILVRRENGREGVKALWKSGWKSNGPKVWLFVAIFLMPIFGLLTLAIMMFFKIEMPWEYGLSPAMIVPIGLLIWLVGAVPEEYGWRGYALPKLLEKYSPLVASLLLGVIWGVWHLPLHLISTTTQYAIPIWQYILQIILLTFMFTFLHLKSKGSVLIAGLFHAFGNITGAVLPYWVLNSGRWISFSLMAAFVVFVVIKEKFWLRRYFETE
ncbi:CPBP family intramembrane metalloprotease [Chloroflexota bacterium]|nr:CPBP family intramembrane metalloprotease [Chloroflexota bacterium]